MSDWCNVTPFFVFAIYRFLAIFQLLSIRVGLIARKKARMLENLRYLSYQGVYLKPIYLQKCLNGISKIKGKITEFLYRQSVLLSGNSCIKGKTIEFSSFGFLSKSDKQRRGVERRAYGLVDCPQVRLSINQSHRPARDKQCSRRIICKEFRPIRKPISFCNKLFS